MTNDKLDKSDKSSDVIRRLDVIAIFLLAQKNIPQKDIAKILGIGDNRIQELFGKNYKKVQPQNIQNNDKKKINKNG